MRQKHLLTKMMLLLAVMLMGVGSAWGQSDFSTTYTSNITYTNSNAKVKIDNTDYDAVKAGTGSSVGSTSITVPEGAKYLHIHAAGWTSETVTISITPNTNLSPSSIQLTSDSGVSGSGNTYTLAGTASDYYTVITFNSALTTATKFTFSATSGKRFVLWGVNYENEPDDGSLATTVTIDDSDISNTDVYLGTDAGSLSATVTAGETIIDGATVVWASENESVATINPTTGAVTLVAAGTTTITALYPGVDGEYKASSGSYELTVTDSTPKTGGWMLTNLADLGEGDVFVIVGNNGSNYAMSNDKGTTDPPTAVSVTIENDEITSEVVDNIKWNISGNATDGYIFYPDGSTTTWLYCTTSNNGVRVGTNTDKTFTIKNDYLYHINNGRYLGIYNSQDWRCYTSINSNIKDQSFGFYKYVDNVTLKAPVITVAETFIGSTTATITCATDGATIYYRYSEDTEWVEYVAELTITATTTIYAKAVLGEEESSVVSKTTTKVLPTPTVTIDATGITNTNVFDGTDAGSLSATVTYNDAAIEGATVTWSGNNDNVATIDATTGVVTLVAAGSVTFTATVAGNNDYNEATATYQMTVTNSDPNLPGTENNPFTVAQALEAITNGSFDANTFYYVSGIISQIDEVNTQYYNATYYISDDGQTTTQLEVYRGKYLDNTNFTSEDQIQVGDEVTVCGKLIYFHNTTPEIASGNYLVNLIHKAVRYYLVGSFDEDSWLDGKIEMTKSGNTYTAEKAFEANTLFKIVKIDETNNNETTWYGGATNDDTYNIHSGWCTDIALTAGDGGKNFKIEAASDDKYTFTVNAEDPDALTLTVTGWHEPVVKYYLAGNWSENWGDGKVELTENADGTFSASKLVGNGTRFKFVKTIDGEETWYGANQTGDDYGIHSAWCTDIELSDNRNASAFIIQMASDRELVFTLNADEMKFNVTGWPISVEGNLFVKVTTTEDFTDGAYLIVNETAGVAFDGSLETLDAANDVIKVKIVDNTIVANSKTKESLFTIVNNGKITSASGHYIGVSSYGNSLKQDESATYYINSVTFDESGNADISINITGSSNYMYLRYNKASDNNRFRYYKSGQENIQLYKLVTATEIPVAVSAAGYATYCSECNLDFSNVNGLTAYKATVTDKQVDFTPAEQVPAGEGVLLKAAEGVYNIPVIDSAEEIDNDFIGVTAETEITETGIFVLMNGDDGVGFYKTTKAFTVGANTAYLPALAGGTEARTFIGFDFNETTAIDGVAAEQMLNGEVYNLQGQRVDSSQFTVHSSQLKRGLYIMNGKKVIVK